MIIFIFIVLILFFLFGFYISEYYNIKKNNKLTNTLKERYKISDEALLDYTINHFKL